jgi:hypothetical protein
MSGNEEQADANLLSAFALTIGGAVGIAFPFDRSDHLDLFLTVLRRWCAAALSYRPAMRLLNGLWRP